MGIIPDEDLPLSISSLMSSPSLHLKDTITEPVSKVSISGLHLGKNLESEDLKPFILGAFYIFTEHASPDIFSLNEIGQRIPIPGPSKNAINQMVNVMLASRTPAIPLVTLIKKETFLDLACAQGFLYSPESGWPGDPNANFYYKDHHYSRIIPTFILGINYPSINDSNLTLSAPTAAFKFDIINGHLMMKDLEAAIQATKN